MKGQTREKIIMEREPHPKMRFLFSRLFFQNLNHFLANISRGWYDMNTSIL